MSIYIYLSLSSPINLYPILSWLFQSLQVSSTWSTGPAPGARRRGGEGGLQVEQQLLVGAPGILRGDLLDFVGMNRVMNLRGFWIFIGNLVMFVHGIEEDMRW